MTSAGPNFSLHVNITVAPENVAKFLQALKPAYEGVLLEPENIFFEVYQDPANPGAFRFVENWNATPQWFQEVQLKKEYYGPYLAITEPMWTKPRTFEIFERMPGNEWVNVKKEMLE
ncbi:hypothetical protein B0J11DRAFT_20977 [Dendryphion nanum]|uniref:ABM domain-containing protein n=1 Tax=Dendryphion nanum TaxID=256645 RepID=A0A9P9IWV4_9PLEO|nr:hypothetical protein B0J11DRAFT_20977 [Dendryphion nanum]